MTSAASSARRWAGGRRSGRPQLRTFVRRAGGHARGGRPGRARQLARARGGAGRGAERRAAVDVVRIGLGPTPMLYYAEAELGVDGGIMITGSHNPADYNGFKMVLGHAAFFGDATSRSSAARRPPATGRRAPGGVADEAVIDRLCRPPAPGLRRRAFRIGWDAGNGAAGPVVEQLVKRLPGEHHTALHRRRRPLPQPPSRPDRRRISRSEAPACASRASTSASPSTATPTGSARSTARAGSSGATSSSRSSPSRCWSRPGATIIADVKASQALFDRVAELGGKPVMWKTGHTSSSRR